MAADGTDTILFPLTSPSPKFAVEYGILITSDSTNAPIQLSNDEYRVSVGDVICVETV